MDTVTEVLSRHRLDEIRRQAAEGRALPPAVALALLDEIERLSEMIVREREMWNLRELGRA